MRANVGWSLRELSERSGESKDMIHRMERGETMTYQALSRVAVALGSTVPIVTRPTEREMRPVLDQSEERVWYLHSAMEKEIPSRYAESALHTEAVRRSLVESGTEQVFGSVPRSTFIGMRLSPNILEIYGPSIRRSHPGEEYLYCVRGTATVTLGETMYTLRTGDGILFFATTKHQYAPAESVLPEELPVILLSVAHGSGAGAIKHPPGLKSEDTDATDGEH